LIRGTMGKSKIKLYAVAKGRNVGIYESWTQCLTQIKGYSGAKYKSFASREKAKSYLDGSQQEINTSHIGNNGSSPNHDPPKKTPSAKFYAVACGRSQGVFYSWDKCQDQINGFSRPVFKRFSSEIDAKEFINNYNRDQSNKKRKLNHRGEEMPKDLPCASLDVKLYFDGGSRGNPGIAGAGAYLVIKETLHGDRNDDAGVQEKDSSTVTEERTIRIRNYCGDNCTNNVAEYTGLLKGLEETKLTIEKFAKKLSGKRISGKKWCLITVSVKGDSNLVIDHLNGYSLCKHINIKEIHTKCVAIIDDMKRNKSKAEHPFFVHITNEHVYRNDNAIADGLANEAMDSKRSWVSESKGNDDIELNLVQDV